MSRFLFFLFFFKSPMRQTCSYNQAMSRARSNTMQKTWDKQKRSTMLLAFFFL